MFSNSKYYNSPFQNQNKHQSLQKHLIHIVWTEIKDVYKHLFPINNHPKIAIVIHQIKKVLNTSEVSFLFTSKI